MEESETHNVEDQAQQPDGQDNKTVVDCRDLPSDTAAVDGAAAMLRLGPAVGSLKTAVKDLDKAVLSRSRDEIFYAFVDVDTYAKALLRAADSARQTLLGNWRPPKPTEQEEFNFDVAASLDDDEANRDHVKMFMETCLGEAGEDGDAAIGIETLWAVYQAWMADCNAELIHDRDSLACAVKREVIQAALDGASGENMAATVEVCDEPPESIGGLVLSDIGRSLLNTNAGIFISKMVAP